MGICEINIAVTSVHFCWENKIVIMPCPLVEKHKVWCAQVIKKLYFWQKWNKERTQFQQAKYRQNQPEQTPFYTIYSYRQSSYI